jgi:hypothetical protein
VGRLPLPGVQVPPLDIASRVRNQVTTQRPVPDRGRTLRHDRPALTCLSPTLHAGGCRWTAAEPSHVDTSSCVRAVGPGLQFAVGPVAVEFTAVTGREGGPEGKVRFCVLEAGGSAKWSQAETQKGSLTLTPVDEHGR